MAASLSAWSRVSLTPSIIVHSMERRRPFFSIVAVDPVYVSTADVLAFVKAQRSAGPVNVVRITVGESGFVSDDPTAPVVVVVDVFVSDRSG